NSNDFSWAGQVDATTDYFVWQRDHRGDSNIKLTDLSTRTGVPLPVGVNTARWEWGPSINGTEMTFIRFRRTADTLYLVDHGTGDKMQIASFDPLRKDFYSAHVFGNWIVWTTLSRSGWNAFVYDIAQSTTARIPNP